MKVLVTGVKGQLGYDVVKELSARGHEAIGVDIEEMDITDAASVNQVIIGCAPDAVIHCAAYTAVDKAEENIDLCRKINTEGTGNIAKVCEQLNSKMMYISTDYVFNGKGERPWEPDDERQPLNVYGLTKYEGELEVEKYVSRFYIVRIAWVFGINGNNFIKTILKRGRENGKAMVVNDQFGSPTYTVDLARLLVDMIETEKFGRYHATNEGFCSWYDFTKEIYKQAGLAVPVEPVSSATFTSKASRPENSRMNKDKLSENGFKRLPSWQDAVARYVKELDIIRSNE